MLLHADSEVRLVELVRDVPPEWSELSSLLHHGVEETQAIEELAPWLGLVAALEEVRVRDGIIQIGAEDVGTHALWRLICHFHTFVHVRHEVKDE